MSAILEIPEVRQRVSPLSVEEYHRLGEFNETGRRTELIRGILIEKMSKSPLHSSLAKLLYDCIAAVLPKGFVVRREDPLTLADSEPEPDIAVVGGSEVDFRQVHGNFGGLGPLHVFACARIHLDPLPGLDEERGLHSDAGFQGDRLLNVVGRIAADAFGSIGYFQDHTGGQFN